MGGFSKSAVVSANLGRELPVLGDSIDRDMAVLERRIESLDEEWVRSCERLHWLETAPCEEIVEYYERQDRQKRKAEREVLQAAASSQQPFYLAQQLGMAQSMRHPLESRLFPGLFDL